MGWGEKSMSHKVYEIDNPTAVIGELAKAFCESYGEESLAVFVPICKRYGYNLGLKMRDNMEGLSFPDRVAAWLAPGIRAGVAEIIEGCDSRVKIKGSYCPLNLQGSKRIVCERLMSIDEGLVSALAEKDISVTIEKTMAQGDQYCLVSFSTK